jgi:precorrin-6B methylase 2
MKSIVLPIFVAERVKSYKPYPKNKTSYVICGAKPRMPKKSLIDDVNLIDEEDKGRPIIFSNQEIRRMLTLAESGPRDVFWDLGCGWGQNLIVALTEFDVSRAVGIEKDVSRKLMCERRLKRWQESYPTLACRWAVIEGDFEKVLACKTPNADLGSPTIVFYGLTTGHGVADSIGRHLAAGARLVYYFNGLFPEILPDRGDFPFYVSVYPFRKPKSEVEWLSAVVGKKCSTLEKGQQPPVSELWDELGHDGDIYGENFVSDYKRRLEKILQRKE